MMKIKALCSHKILQHETIHNTMSHVNIEQSRVGRKKTSDSQHKGCVRQINRRQDVFQNRREKCLLTNLDIRVAEADN